MTDPTIGAHSPRLTDLTNCAVPGGKDASGDADQGLSKNAKTGIAGLIEVHYASLLTQLHMASPERRPIYLAAIAEFKERIRGVSERLGLGLDFSAADAVVHLPIKRAKRRPSGSPVKLRLVKNEARS